MVNGWNGGFIVVSILQIAPLIVPSDRPVLGRLGLLIVDSCFFPFLVECWAKIGLTDAWELWLHSTLYFSVLHHVLRLLISII